MLVFDVLGEPYLAETIELSPDEEGEVVATLVSRREAAEPRGAVLHVHGFCDYFFQTVAADFWVERGYDFYALDLRKYGRSLLPHQTPNFATDLAVYHEELDEAVGRILERDGHERLLISGHSTGGLIASLWLAERDLDVAGIFLNAPWLDLNGSLWQRTAGTQIIDQIGARRPRQLIPRSVSGLYGRSLHVDHGGEWDFDTGWKPLDSFPVYAGWLRAIRRGHAAAHRGLGLQPPILVLTSARSLQASTWEPAVDETDVVLDVELIAKWAHRLGSHVSLIRVPGARHDVTLSAQPARDRVFDQLDRWLTAYVER